MNTFMPHLWFDHHALEAATFYVSLFDNAEIYRYYTIPATPSGDAIAVNFRIENMDIGALDGGPFFKMNPSVSLMVSCHTKEEVNHLYENLKQGGRILMPLDAYPFSDWYVWVEDRYGLSWQLILEPEGYPKLRLNLLFADKVCGKAEKALQSYINIFPNAHIKAITYYDEGEAQDTRARLKYSELQLEDIELVLMDHGFGGEENFTEALSIIVNCDNQKEIDTYWEKLSKVPEAEACGWCKDDYGVSWQIVPRDFDDIFFEEDAQTCLRYTLALLEMKKLDIQALDNARYGRKPHEKS